ncbi:MAG: GAF domain-containing sensor histidine kinase, partial [Candidatus Bathyarchaeota archaeon]|nr:GAF domain-containing sensor histidine kinase [Candidatus Bathyarchaeota archaeon]
ITESLPASKSIDEIAEKIETAVREIIGFDIGSFGLVKGNVLHHEYIWGVDISENIILPLDGNGVTVRAVQTGETQHIRDTRKESNYYTPDEVGETGSELCIPVKIAGNVAAVINIESRTIDAFSLQDVSLLSILSEHVGSTMYNLRLLENERAFTKRLEALSTAVASLNATEKLEMLAAETLAIIDEIMEVPYSSFSIIKDNQLVAIKSKGAPLIDLNMPIDGSGITVRAVREKKTILVHDTRLDPDYVKGSTESLSELAIPVIVDGESKGVINMESLELGYFNSTHQSLSETLAANVASNIQRIQREEAMREAERRAIREQERAEQAIELEEMKTGFIRTATHEIRTPLTSIKGYTQLAQRKIETSDTTDLDKYFDAILRNTERLESLSADLLDVQRIESGRLELNKAPASIHDMLNALKLEMKPILDSRNQELLISGEDYQLNVDRIRMMQVLVNLVMNASKFSPENSDINIAIDREGDMVRISVIDEGVGINKEDIHKIFKPFPGIRVKGVKDSTGLGLS